ncbi:hypothetical protein CR513_40360, partial [Mucuna pruriens]
MTLYDESRQIFASTLTSKASSTPTATNSLQAIRNSFLNGSIIGDNAHNNQTTTLVPTIGIATPQHNGEKEVAMPVMRNQASSSSGNEEQALQHLLRVERSEEQALLTEEVRRRQEEAERFHEEEIRRAEEREASLRAQLELLKNSKGCSDLPLPKVAWGQPFNE